MNPIKPERLAVISLWAEDVPATAHFYRDIIGLPLLPHHGQRPAFDLGNGAFLVIVKGNPRGYQPDQDTRFPVIAFAVNDLDEAISQLQAQQVDLPWGVETASTLSEAPGSRWVQFLDPAGNLIELVQFHRDSSIEQDL